MRAAAFFLLFLFALLTVALHRAASPAAAKPGDLRLSSIASELARRHVVVHCEGAGDNLTGVDGESGRTMFIDGQPADETFLLVGICERLHSYSQLTKTGVDCLLPCDGSTLETAWSLNALAHESYHLWGAQEEAKAECYGLQSIFYVANRLGAPLEEAKALGRLYWTSVYRQHGTQWPKYYSADCRNGGRLDLRQADSRWPE